MPADWQTVTIPAGGTESPEIPLTVEQVNVPPGQVTTSDGRKVTGKDRQEFIVQGASDGHCKIVLTEHAAAAQDLVFRYKAVGEGHDEDEAEDEAETEVEKAKPEPKSEPKPKDEEPKPAEPKAKPEPPAVDKQMHASKSKAAPDTSWRR